MTAVKPEALYSVVKVWSDFGFVQPTQQQSINKYKFNALHKMFMQFNKKLFLEFNAVDINILAFKRTL